MQSAPPTYLTLSPNCSFRLLEKPCVYNRARDELYELDQEAGNFLSKLPIPTNGPEIEQVDTEFLEYCMEEGIFSYISEYIPRRSATQSPIPSLRYLLLHITTRCNLKCVHCFLGDAEPLDLSLERIVRVMEEFDELQGLRLLVSGGEPLLHPQFWELNDLFEKFGFRAVILSNGITLEDPRVVGRLRAHEVQVSLDGVGRSHDALRGAGTYRKVMRGLENLAESGVDVSVATMIHAGNLADFDRLERIVREIDAREWNIDVPSRAGRWRQKSMLEADANEVGPILRRAFGGGTHHSADSDWACGAHLCAVMADGTICKCGFYASLPSGTLADGLAEGWRNIPRIKIDRLSCDCEMIEDCRGGCRYRAEMEGDRFGKDPVMCAANGLPC